MADEHRDLHRTVRRQAVTRKLGGRVVRALARMALFKKRRKQNDHASEGAPLDFSHVDSVDKARDLAAQGELEQLLLLPTVFGGEATSVNVVYVPVGVGEVKASIDENVVLPMVRDGNAGEYTANASYESGSVVPTQIEVRAWDPGSFTTNIKIWGTPTL